MNKALFLFDDSLERESLHDFLSTRFGEIHEIVLCPLTTDERMVEDVVGILHGIGVKCDIMPFLKILNEKALGFRNDYVESVRSLTMLNVRSKTLVEHFCYPHENYSSWWFGIRPEKSALKSKTFQRYSIVRTVVEEISARGCSKVIVFLRDAVLTRALKEASAASATEVISDDSSESEVYRVGWFSKLFDSAKRMLAWWGRVRTEMEGREGRFRRLGKCRHIFVTYFPLIDKTAYREGKYVNRYLGPLQSAVEKKYGGINATIAIGIDAEGWTKFDSIDIAQRLNRKGSNIIFWNEAMTAGDILSASIYYLYMAVKYLRLRRHIRKTFEERDDAWLWHFWQGEMDSTFLGAEIITPFLMHRAFNRLLSDANENCIVSYIAEMHAWEAALNAAVRQFKNIRTVGIQHTQVPLLLLNYFESPSNLTWGKGRHDLPLPDRMGCVGEITEKIFMSSGWPEERLFQLGALRAERDVHSCGMQSPALGYLPRCVTVSLPYDVDETMELLKLVVAAFREMNDLTVYIKFHPALRLNVLRMMQGFPEEILSSPFVITDEPNEELMRKSSVMVVGSSSSCLAALSAGRKMVVPLVASSLCLNPIFGLSDLPIYVTGAGDLRRAVKDVMRNWVVDKDGSNFYQSYYLIHKNDHEYLMRLESAVGIDAEGLA